MLPSLSVLRLLWVILARQVADQADQHQKQQDEHAVLHEQLKPEFAIDFHNSQVDLSHAGGRHPAGAPSA